MQNNLPKFAYAIRFIKVMRSTELCVFFSRLFRFIATDIDAVVIVVIVISCVVIVVNDDVDNVLLL